MKSSTAGRSISRPDILNISASGIWLFVLGKEYFLAYTGYPWFKDAPVKGILNVRLLNRIHLHWPDLDIDLEVIHKYVSGYLMDWKVQPSVVAGGSRLHFGFLGIR